MLGLPGNILTLGGRLYDDEDLDLDHLRLDVQSGNPQPPSTADTDHSEYEIDSAVLTIKDQGDSPRQGMSVSQWLEEWKWKWESMCKQVEYAHKRHTFRANLVPS